MLTGLYTSETPLQTSYFIPQVSYESSISYLTPSSNRIYSRLNILRSKVFFNIFSRIYWVFFMFLRNSVESDYKKERLKFQGKSSQKQAHQLLHLTTVTAVLTTPHNLLSIPTSPTRFSATSIQIWARISGLWWVKKEKNKNFIEVFVVFLGLVNNESLCEESGGKNEENKEFGADIEEILQIAKVEKDPFRLFILINRLANMVKEKDEQISLLKRKISECQESSQLH